MKAVADYNYIQYLFIRWRLHYNSEPFVILTFAIDFYYSHRFLA